MNPVLLKNHSPLERENNLQFANRYKGYGKDLYAYLEDHDKAFYDKLKFFKAKDNTINDSYALYSDNGKSLVIQLDPDCQTIIIWDEYTENEYGIWSDLNYSVIYQYLTTLILAK